MNPPKPPVPQIKPSSLGSLVSNVSSWLRQESLLIFTSSREQILRFFRMAVGAKNGLTLKTELKVASRVLGSKLESLGLGDLSLRSELSAINQSLSRQQTMQDAEKQQQLQPLQAKQAALHVRLATDYLSGNPTNVLAVQEEISAVRRLTLAVSAHEATMGQYKKSLFAPDTATNVRAGIGLVSIALLGLLLLKGFFPKRSYSPYDAGSSWQLAHEIDFEKGYRAERQRAERELAEKAKARKNADLKKSSQIKEIVRRGDKLRDAGKLQEAVTTYKAAFEIDANSAFAFDGQGQVMMLLEQWRDAIPFFDKAVRKDRTLPGPVLNRARCFIVLGDYRRALSDLNLAIQLDPMNAESFSLRAHANRELKDFPSALRDVDTALKIDDRLADPYFNRGCILSINPDTCEDAIRSFTTAIRNDPAHAMSYYLRGTIFLQQKEFDKAVRDFSSAIDADHNLIDAHSSRAFVNAMTGNHQQAVKDFTTVLRKSSADDAAARLLLARGESYNALNQFSKAEEDFGRVLEIKPASLEALQNRIVARQGLGDGNGEEADKAQIASLTRSKTPGRSLFPGVGISRPVYGGYTNSDNSDYYMQRAVQQAQYESQQAMNRFRTQRAGRLAAMGVHFN